jgi:hypothetical protein
LPRPLPFDELLATLKERGLPIGLREHLLVGRLLDRWPGAELKPLRSALAALLARNTEEVTLVRTTFDELYGERPEPPPPPPPLPPLTAPRRRWEWVAAIVLGALLSPSSLDNGMSFPVEVPPARGAAERPTDAPKPPTISDEIPRPDPVRALAVAGGLATFVFLWLYGGRIRRETRRLGHHRWRREAGALPPPYRYQPDLSGMAPPFPSAALDEAAQILGRRAPAPPRLHDLDIDRTLQRTLEAGLAPKVVLRQQSTTPMLLVLEDTGGEMRLWRRSVRALLTGLAVRGVPFDIWRFQADAHHVFRTPGGEVISLERLARLRASSPLLVISTGEGLLAGQEGCMAPWVGLLAAWTRRAWLHPVPDAAYWRPALREASVDVWPLTPGGVLAAARRLAGISAPPRSTAPVFPHRPVTPLDVDRLRWLLTLVPERDPDLVELLRQQIFPTTSPAALVEALESPPLRTPPPLAPPAEAVHQVLASLIAASPPPLGSAARERWRLDLALQEVHVPESLDRALEELQDLARGPFAAEVERAADRLSPTLDRPLRRSLEARAEQEGLAVARAEGPPRPRWRWPDLVEVASTLACIGLLFWGMGRFSARPEPVEAVELYTLGLEGSGIGFESFTLVASRRGQAPARAQLYQQDHSRSTLVFDSDEASVELNTDDRGHWYYLRSPLGQDELAISNRVWVPLLNDPDILRPATGTERDARRRFLKDLPFGTAISAGAERHNVDGLLVAAIVEVESKFQPKAVSPKGAVGLMVIPPSIGEMYGAGDLFDPYVNIDVGSRYIRQLLRDYSGDVELALAAYNAGPAAVDRYAGVPPYRETRQYVRKVLARYQEYSQSAGVGVDAPRDP